MNAKGVLEQDADAAQAVTIEAPPVEEDEVPTCVGTERFVNEPDAIMFENGRSGRQSPS